MVASGEDTAGAPSTSPAVPPLGFGRAFEAAASYRGGAGVYPSNRSDKDEDHDAHDHLRPVIAAAVEGIGIGAGKDGQQARLIIDHVRENQSRRPSFRFRWVDQSENRSEPYV